MRRRTVRVAVHGVAVFDWRDPEPDRIEAGPIGPQRHSDAVPQGATPRT